ncbi:hypothetical protein BGZ65_012368, partial [Modicella reniformis]
VPSDRNATSYSETQTPLLPQGALSELLSLLGHFGTNLVANQVTRDSGTSSAIKLSPETRSRLVSVVPQK